eukprot:31440-Pelagococcus_subviridis.AAC.16
MFASSSGGAMRICASRARVAKCDASRKRSLVIDFVNVGLECLSIAAITSICARKALSSFASASCAHPIESRSGYAVDIGTPARVSRDSPLYSPPPYKSERSSSTALDCKRASSSTEATPITSASNAARKYLQYCARLLCSSFSDIIKASSGVSVTALCAMTTPYCRVRRSADASFARNATSIVVVFAMY